MSINYLVGYYAVESAKSVLWWSGSKILYVVAPSILYKLANMTKVYHVKSENQQILDELKILRQEIQEISKRTQIPIAEEDILEIEPSPIGLRTRFHSRNLDSVRN